MLVDDFKPWRSALRSILESVAGFQVVGEASDGIEAIEYAGQLLPDIVLLDIQMPRLNGIAAAKIIMQCCPDLKIIFVSQQDEIELRSIALSTGAFAYLLKTRIDCELWPTIERALLSKCQSSVLLSPSVQRLHPLQ